jgi:hypothetical protein
MLQIDVIIVHAVSYVFKLQLVKNKVKSNIVLRQNTSKGLHYSSNA